MKGDASAVEENPNQLHIFPVGVSNMAMIYMCEPRVMARGRSEMARYPRIHRVVIKVAGSSTLGVSACRQHSEAVERLVWELSEVRSWLQQQKDCH